jgi:hypothetical protein
LARAWLIARSGFRNVTRRAVAAQAYPVEQTVPDRRFKGVWLVLAQVAEDRSEPTIQLLVVVQRTVFAQLLSRFVIAEIEASRRKDIEDVLIADVCGLFHRVELVNQLKSDHRIRL